MRAKDRAGFEEFVRGEATALFRSAYLLVGSRFEAEDLLQEALERTYRRWDRTAIDNPSAYVRRAMANLAVNRWRKRRPLSVALSSDHEPEVSDETARVDQRSELARALACLSRRQRIVLVLRYWEDMSERETARTVGCSVGSVKRHAARGLQRLRQVMRTPSARQAQPVLVEATTNERRL